MHVFVLALRSIIISLYVLKASPTCFLEDPDYNLGLQRIRTFVSHFQAAAVLQKARKSLVSEVKWQKRAQY